MSTAVSKYRNKRYNGYASQREAQLAADLHALERSGVITELREQVRYTLVPSQEGLLRTERPVTYVADFVYKYNDGVLHVVDCKGFRTKDYIIKRKLMAYLQHIEVEEV